MSGLKPLEVYAFTWNMARKSQLGVKWEIIIPEPQKYDLIIFSAQEADAKSKMADSMKAYLGPDYIKVGYIEMWEMFTVAFLKKQHAPFFKNPETNYLTLGVMNVVGNKGGLMLQFTLFDRTFNIINVHLTSGTGKAHKRAEMMANILRGIAVAKAQDKVEPDSVCDFNYIMGDMNWRTKRTYSECIDSVE